MRRNVKSIQAHTVRHSKVRFIMGNRERSNAYVYLAASFYHWVRRKHKSSTEFCVCQALLPCCDKKYAIFKKVMATLNVGSDYVTAQN